MGIVIVWEDLASAQLCIRVEWGGCRERKNVNLPGVVVDLPTLTKKDEEDLTKWGLINDIDFIAASFVRKGSDVTNIRKVQFTSACSVLFNVMLLCSDHISWHAHSTQHENRHYYCNMPVLHRTFVRLSTRDCN